MVQTAALGFLLLVTKSTPYRYMNLSGKEKKHVIRKKNMNKFRGQNSLT